MNKLDNVVVETRYENNKIFIDINRIPVLRIAKEGLENYAVTTEPLFKTSVDTLKALGLDIMPAENEDWGDGYLRIK